jgi:hypothetical protein
MLNQTQIARYWGPACSGKRATISLHGAGKVTVRAAIVEATKALNQCLVVWNYRTRRADTGAFVCRQKVSGNGWSNHSYATAIDINWQLNPYGGSRHHIPKDLAAAICRIRTKNGRQVWNWGGYWGGTRDWMHFEIVCTPRDIATGINWNTVAGFKPSKPAPKVDWAGVRRYAATILLPQVQSLPNLNGNSKNKNQIIVLQKALNLVGNAGLVEDGQYGPATGNAVLNFQKWMNALGAKIKDFPGAAHEGVRWWLSIALKRISEGKG